MDSSSASHRALDQVEILGLHQALDRVEILGSHQALDRVEILGSLRLRFLARDLKLIRSNSAATVFNPSPFLLFLGDSSSDRENGP